MGRRRLRPDRASPDWEPQDVLLKVYVTRSFALALEKLAADVRLSKSMVVRESVRRGLPSLINDVRWLEQAGYRPAVHVEGVATIGAGRGVEGDGVVAARWLKTPDGVAGVSPVPAREGDSD